MNRRFKIAGKMPEDFGDNFSFISSLYYSPETISLPIKYGKFIALFASQDRGKIMCFLAVKKYAVIGDG